jgi:hypothetical protein
MDETIKTLMLNRLDLIQHETENLRTRACQFLLDIEINLKMIEYEKGQVEKDIKEVLGGND